MSNKDVSFSLNLDELEEQLEEKRNIEGDPEEKVISVRSTVFSLGKDPRVGTKHNIAAPDLYLIEILKDRLDNPYLEINWKMPRQDIDSGRVVGFNIWRRRMSNDDALTFGGVRSYSINAFDKLARGNKRLGRFSSDRKAIYNIKRGSIPVEVLNSNLAELKGYENSQIMQDTDEDSPSYTEAEFEKFFAKRKFEKLAYVDYTKFSAEEKKKFLLVKDRNFVDVSFKDKAVGFSETFEYYVECVAKELEDVPRSGVVQVTIEDLNIVPPPRNLKAIQVNENEIELSISVDPQDKVSKVSVYRRSDDEITFDLLIEAEMTADSIGIVDEDTRYTKTYTYRVFSENIHGNISEPSEIRIVSSVQRITPQSRSNVLKIPIMSAVQDQNSDYVKVTIYPNDPSIYFYEIKRRDLTIHERRFAVPSKTETNYGGDGWETNQFFIEKTRETITLTSKEDTSPLKTKTIAKEVVFVDDTVAPNHIYTYRVRGYDLFGNASSYSFATVKVIGKKSIRTPFNIRAEVLRGFPFRVKIMWDDDSLASLLSAAELFMGESTLDKKENKTLFRVQRRKLGETVYESFPLTANKFVVDEVSTADAVTFEGKAIDDTFEKLDNSDIQDENLRIKDEIRRAFKMPNFLKENDIYFYRITATSFGGDESNASEEFQISTLADMSDPLNFNAQVINTKVKPMTALLSWDNDPEKARPDFWIIEKKFDSENDSFSVLGKSYLKEEFLDRDLEIGNTYVYRIKAFDAIGRESSYFETRLTL